MKLVDSRRLVGPNLQTRRPGALVEIAFEEGEDPVRAIALWEEEARALGQATAIELHAFGARSFKGGAALFFEAPLDLLLVSTDLNDAAVERATRRLRGEPSADEPILAELIQKRDQQRSPALMAIASEAARRDVPLLWDDSTLSLGCGKGTRTWPLEALPAFDEIDWSAFARIPVALITGTNGKSTSARLLARMVRCAGQRPGLASTDFISVNEQVIERGDYTGPAAARLVLRHPEVEVAVLETARGGILRRGLAIDRVDAALITNVADDHLGEYGIDSVEELARAKAVVGSVVQAHGRVVLNADDPRLVRLARARPETFSAPLVWFSLDPAHPVLVSHLHLGGEAWSVVEGALVVRGNGSSWQALVRVDEVPLAWGGAAAYNLANALGAAACAQALGLPRAAIVEGLRSFRSSPEDNPGRANLLAVGDSLVLLDFGHNAHGVHEVGKLVAALRAGLRGVPAAPGPLSVIAACAGDRSDQNLRDLAAAIVALGPSRVLLRDLPGYLRGRQPGEVPRLLTGLFIELGMQPDAIEIHASEAAAIASALDRAGPGELVVALVHLESDAVSALLAARGARTLA